MRGRLSIRQTPTGMHINRHTQLIMYSWTAKLFLSIAIQLSCFPTQMLSAAISLCGHCYSKTIMLSIYSVPWQTLTGTNYWLKFRGLCVGAALTYQQSYHWQFTVWMSIYFVYHFNCHSWLLPLTWRYTVQIKTCLGFKCRKLEVKNIYLWKKELK